MYQINACSTSAAAMKNAPPMLALTGHAAKQMAPAPSSSCIITQMLVVSARMREARAKRTQSAETTQTQASTRPRGSTSR